ncbi:MAG: DUF3168 domain-containing protein [Mangrovicoccus sp.]
MSYAVSPALQKAVYAALTNYAGLSGTEIFDAPPQGQVPPLYIALGPEDVSDRSDASSSGAVHRLIISVVNQSASFHALKSVAAEVSDCLHDAQLTLDRGRLTSLTFLKARARRASANETRRIDLWFRAAVEDI